MHAILSYIPELRVPRLLLIFVEIPSFTSLLYSMDEIVALPENLSGLLP
jgi:hypothetical protein